MHNPVDDENADYFGNSIQSMPWEIISQRRWSFRDHINETELETIVQGVRQLAMDGYVRDAWLAWLTDNSTALYVVRKGRSSKFGLRRRLLRLAGLLLYYNIRLEIRWVPSRHCVADEPSRDKNYEWFRRRRLAQLFNDDSWYDCSPTWTAGGARPSAGYP